MSAMNGEHNGLPILRSPSPGLPVADLRVEARQAVTGIMEAFLRTQAENALRAASLRAWLLRVSVLDTLLRAFCKRLHDGENRLDEAQAEIRRLRGLLAEQHCCVRKKLPWHEGSEYLCADGHRMTVVAPESATMLTCEEPLDDGRKCALMAKREET